MANSNYKYFLYSSSQMRDRTAIEKKVSRTFVPGIVVVGNKKLEYTELSSDGHSNYSDAKIVAEGDIRKMVYTSISSRMGV